MNYVKYIGVPMVALLMAACAQKTETAYYWGDYQSSVYDYYNNNTSTQQQIDALNKIIEQAKEKINLCHRDCMHI